MWRFQRALSLIQYTNRRTDQPVRSCFKEVRPCKKIVQCTTVFSYDIDRYLCRGLVLFVDSQSIKAYIVLRLLKTLTSCIPILLNHSRRHLPRLSF